MKVKVLFFGPIREKLNRSSEWLEVQEGISVYKLKKFLVDNYPSLKRLKFAIAVDGEFCSDTYILKKKSETEIALIPPVSGGSKSESKIFVQITKKAIRPEKLFQRAKRTGGDGAEIIFLGIVRNTSKKGEPVKKIIYEAYKSMAEKKLKEISDSAIEKFNISSVIIVHRIGEVKVCEVSLFVSVMSQHRKEGLKAISWIIDRLKKTVPIWKKEILVRV